MSESEKKVEETKKAKKILVKLPKSVKIMGATTMTKKEAKFFRQQMVLGYLAKMQSKSSKKTVMEYAREAQAPEG